MWKASYQVETESRIFYWSMSNKVVIDLELYDRLRSNAEGFRLLSNKEEMFFVSMERSTSNCGEYVSKYLQVLTKDDTVNLLAQELKDVKQKLQQAEKELIGIKYEAANRRKWF
jgi:regulator of sigma D